MLVVPELVGDIVVSALAELSVLVVVVEDVVDVVVVVEVLLEALVAGKQASLYLDENPLAREAAMLLCSTNCMNDSQKV